MIENAEKLDPRPARQDLTDRELTKIIGGLLGALSQMTNLGTLRRAVRWWAETDEAWEAMRQNLQSYEQLLARIKKGEHR